MFNCFRWEQERVRQEHLALERWRQEAREHEKQLFGMFCHAMSQCNAALTTMLRLVKLSLNYYSVIRGFGQANSAYGGSILGLSQFSQLLQLPLEMELALKVVESD